MMRFVIPSVEIRIAGGRETTLKHLQALALYPANSMFTAGYLTTGGQDYETDKEMIESAGFEVEMNDDISNLPKKENHQPALHPNHA